MKLERSTPEDAKECTSWMLANLELNDCSPRTLKGSTFWKIPGILYLPVKPVLMLESLAPNPLVTGRKRLLALRRAMNDLQKMYPGVEFVFLTKGHTSLDDAAKRYGFEESPYVLFRLIDAAEARKRAKARKKSMAQARLRNHARALRPNGFASERIMRNLSEPARRESAGSRP